MTTSVSTPDAPADVGPPVRGSRRWPVWRGLVLAALVLAAGFAVPYVLTNTYSMSIALDAAILGLLALGIGFLGRRLGVISLGHTAFYGGAAYAVGIATTHWGWGPSAAFGVAVCLGVVLSLLMGVLVVRSSGMAFLMLTLALGQALYQLSVQTSARPVTGGYDGLQVTYGSARTFFGLSQADVGNPGLFWPFAWIALVASAVVLWLVGRSRFGTVLEGIRENEERMRFSGYDTFRPRLLAFVLSGLVASVGGALFAVNAGYVSPDVLGFTQAGDSLIAAIVGGLGTLLGPAVGAALYAAARSYFNSGGNLELYTGAALVVVLVFVPGGVTGGARHVARWLTRRNGGQR